MTYNLSTLEKLLGKYYKWWYLIIYGIKINTKYIFSDILWYMGRLVSVFTVLYIYNLAGDKESLEKLILTNVFFAFTTFFASYDLDEHISTGKITNELLFPSSIFKIYFFRRIGIAIRGIVFNVLLFIGVLNFNNFNFNILRFTMVILSFITIMYFIKFLFDFIVGSLSFWLINGYGAINLYLSLTLILSGSIILLDDLHDFIKFNPFAFVAYHPMQIYLGNYDTYQIILTFFGGIIWSLSLYVIAKLIFRLGLKKNESVGL
jgi:ABC-2 type transport system permease protein